MGTILLKFKYWLIWRQKQIGIEKAARKSDAVITVEKTDTHGPSISLWIRISEWDSVCHVLAGCNSILKGATYNLIAAEQFGESRAADEGAARSLAALVNDELILQTGRDTFLTVSHLITAGWGQESVVDQ